MRIVEKILYGIGGLIALLLLFILACRFNPSLSDTLGSTLYAKGTETSDVPDVISVANQLLRENGMATLPANQERYIVPADENLKIPKKVSNLNGFKPYVGKGSGISSESAEQIEAEITEGELGEDLTFERKFYPYYYMLNEVGQSLYKQFYANANAVNSTFKPVVPASGQLVNTVFSAVCNDHPELFWIETSFRYMYDPSGKVARVDLSFNSTIANLDACKAKFEEAAMSVVYLTRGASGEYEIEKAAHDYLIKQVKYDLQAPMNQSAYSALCIGRTVCAGYARAYQYIMQKLNIPCYYVTGFAGENHAWNIVKIGKDYYNVDTTWDDTDPSTRDYFNCSDSEFAPTHIRRDLSIYLPACNATKYGSDIKAEEIIKEKEEEKKKESAKEDSKKEEASNNDDNDSSSEDDRNREYTLKDFGFKEEDVITKSKDYYVNCAETLLATKKKSITFRNVVVDKELWEKIETEYKNGDYESAYMDRVIAEKHYNRCNMKVTAYPLDDGYYVIEHNITFK